MKVCKPTAVFLGPSLRRDEARSILEADYYPPACKGDVYRIIPSGVKTIILIDGVFHSTPAVWQRELLAAMEEGIRVVGASSMGALRAVELHEFGMIGFGTVFEWYRNGWIEGDDEVALLHGPAELDYRPLSEPLVNIRYTLLRAVADGCLEAGVARELAAYAKQLYYPNRSYRRLLESAVLDGWPRKAIARLERYFWTKRKDIKMLDARGALRHGVGIAARRGRGNRPKSRCFARESWWERERLLLSAFVGTRVVTGREILERARTDEALLETMRTVLSKRRFLVEWARQNGVACPEEFLRATIQQWRRQRRRSDRRAWLLANGLTQRACLRLVAERALLDWLDEVGPMHFGLKRGFIAEWARQNGVMLPPDRRARGRQATQDHLEARIVQRGPCHFGLDWSFETALLQELQVTGKAADLAEQPPAG